MKTYSAYINGEFMDTKTTTNTINPATEEIISIVSSSTIDDARVAIDAAEQAQNEWARLPAIRRAQYLWEVARRIREKSDYLARIITEEQGKILSLSKSEVELAASILDYSAEWARRYEGEILQSDRENENIFIFKKPIGVVSGILPWNYPFSSIARKMGPALITGNTIVIKPSEITSNNAIEFAKIVDEVGLPEGVFNVVPGKGSEIGGELVSNSKVGMVTFTGSVETGERILQNASKNITKVSLELGGKAPAIVMDDADIDKAIHSIVQSRIANSGQLCICPERVYVHEKIIDEFTEKYIKAKSAVTYGDPLSENIDMGPLVSKTQLQSVEAHVNKAVEQGAQLALGGKRAQDKKGYYFEPTVLVNCSQGMDIIRQEIFGPVTPILSFQSLDEAIHLANDSDYGLSSSIYANDLSSIMHACNELKFGETFVNRENGEAFHAYHAGWRHSGIGGDDGKHGLNDYLQKHVVYMQYDY